MRLFSFTLNVKYSSEKMMLVFEAYVVNRGNRSEREREREREKKET